MSDWQPNFESVAGNLFGRQSELNQLQGLLDRAMLGHGAMVVVGGAPGVGKSRLAEVACEAARKMGFRVLAAHCSEVQGAPPFWPWIQLLAEYLRQTASTLEAEDQSELRRRVSDLLSALNEQANGVHPRRTSGDSARSRFELFDGVANFADEAATRTPVMVLLDDVHCADLPSLKLLEFLARPVRAIAALVLLTVREVDKDPKHPLNDSLGEIARYGNLERIALSGIDSDASAALIGAEMGYRPSQEILARVHARTEGNPLFIHEMIRHLRAKRSSHGFAESQQVGEELEARLPESIRQIIGVRLNRFQERQLKVMQLASVIGREFSIAILELASTRDRADIPHALAAAIESGIIEHSAQPHVYRFSHGLLRETLYERIEASLCQQFHVDVGQAIERRYAHDIDPHLAALSHHYRAALPLGYACNAASFAERCGNQCLARLAFEEASRQYELALEAMASAPHRAPADETRVQISLGRAWLLAGDSVHALQAFHQATQSARTAGDVVLHTAAAIEFEEASWRFSILGGVSLGPLKEALSSLGGEDVGIRADVMSSLGRALLYTGTVDQALKTGHEAIFLAREAGDAHVLVRALFRGLAALDLVPERFSQRLAVAEEGIRLARQTGQRDYLLYFMGWHVYNLTEAGDGEAREQYLVELGKLAQEQRQPLYLYVYRSYQTQGGIYAGRFHEAELSAAESARMADRIPELDCAGAFGVQMLCLRRAQGRLGEIAPMLASFERETIPEARWKPGLMLVHCDLGRRDRARAIYEELVKDDLKSIEHDARWLLTMVCVTEVCADLEDVRRAELIYRQLLPYGGRNLVVGHHMINFGPADRYLAILAGMQGWWDESESRFAAAASACAKQGAAPILAEVRYRWATMLRMQDSAANRERVIELLDLAQEGAAGLAMRVLVERIRSMRTLVSRVRRRPGYSNGLSPRELEVLRLVAKGRSNSDIASILFVSKNTVAKQVRSILMKTGSANRTEAASFALRNTLL